MDMNNYHNGSFFAMSFVEVDHFFEGKIAYDVRIEYKKRIVRRP